MKRLWVRLSAVAGLVVALGGGGYYYFINTGTVATGAAETKKELAKTEDLNQKKIAVPLSDENTTFSPAYGGASPDITGDRGPDDLPAKPTTANWQNTGSQTIRQVSINDQTEGYGSAEYQVGDATVADASDAYAERLYPTGSYGESVVSPPTSTPPTDPNSAYNVEGPPVVGPSYLPQDPNQPVAAPNFAGGEAVGSGSPAQSGIGLRPVVNSPSTAGSSPLAYDPSPAPAFDPPLGTPIAPLERPSATAYPLLGSADPQLPAYGPTPTLPAGNAALVAAIPGDRSLDGRQTPSISIEKTAPAETQVGKPAAFKTLIRNTSDVTARNVIVTDRPPQGTQLIDATPQPVQAPDGSLVWIFESLAPGEEVLISMQVMPLVEGELGSLARITFEAQASVRTICTKPQLLIEHSTDPQVLIGETVVFDITISNPGSGDATGIILEEDVPRGLSHGAGSELEYEVGTLRPGESIRLELKLKASEAGVTINKLRVRGDANLLAEHTIQLEVIAPNLVVGLTGPLRRFLDRQVKYQVTFRNAGTAPARNVELVTYLPKGLKFVSTSGKGQYDRRDHAVYWSLDHLAPGQTGDVELVAVPIATGEQKLQIEGTADLGLSHTYEHITVVEAITELVFTVSDTQDPIEVGSETIYEVRIVNEGSKTATNVQLDALLPVALTPISGEGTTRVVIQGQEVLMEPLPRLAPGEEAVYKIKVRGRQAGDHLVDIRLVCNEIPTPVTKQESTKVYADGL